jgi:chromosome segregation ATPase
LTPLPPHQVHAHQRRLAVEQCLLAKLETALRAAQASVEAARAAVGGERALRRRLDALDASKAAASGRRSKLLVRRNTAAATLRGLRSQVDSLRVERSAHAAVLTTCRDDVDARAACMEGVLATAAQAHAARDEAQGQVAACAAAADVERSAFQAQCDALSRRIAHDRRVAREASRQGEAAAQQAAAMAAAAAAAAAAKQGRDSHPGARPGDDVAHAAAQIADACRLVGVSDGNALVAAFGRADELAQGLVAHAGALRADLATESASVQRLRRQVDASRAAGRAMYAQRRDAVSAAEARLQSASQRIARMAARRQDADRCVAALHAGVQRMAQVLGMSDADACGDLASCLAASEATVARVCCGIGALRAAREQPGGGPERGAGGPWAIALRASRPERGDAANKPGLTPPSPDAAAADDLDERPMTRAELQVRDLIE